VSFVQNTRPSSSKSAKPLLEVKAPRRDGEPYGLGGMNEADRGKPKPRELKVRRSFSFVSREMAGIPVCMRPKLFHHGLAPPFAVLTPSVNFSGALGLTFAAKSDVGVFLDLGPEHISEQIATNVPSVAKRSQL
jgi:hypothetical protein